jgi:integrase
MSKRYIKSSRFTGVYYENLKDGDKSYSITYNLDGKSKRKKIGNYSQEIRENYCFQMRIMLLNHGDEAFKEKSENITLNEVADIYYNRDVKSFNRIFGRYNKHFKNWIGNKALSDINKSVIINIDRKTDLSHASKNFLIDMLRSLYNYTIDYELYDGKNPFSNLKRPKPKNARERFLSSDKIKNLFENIKDKELIYLFTKLALNTGARLETICLIKKDDFLEDGRLRLVDLKRDGMVYYSYYDDEIYNLAMQSKYNYILQRTANKNYISHKIQRELQPILNKLFNPERVSTKEKVVIHSLRHTFASHLALKRTPIYVIQKLMNHADIKMTMRYAKLAPDSGKEFVNGLYS